MADCGRPWWNGSSVKTPPPSNVVIESPRKGKGMTPILLTTPAAMHVKSEPLSPRCKPPAFSPHIGKQGAFPILPVKSEPVAHIKSEPMAYLERALMKGEFPLDFNWPLMKWEPITFHSNPVKKESKHYIPNPLGTNVFSRMDFKFQEAVAQRNYNRPTPNWHYIYTRERYEPTDATRAWWNADVERALNKRREAYLRTKERFNVPIEVRMERIFQFQLAKDEVRRVVAESKWKAQFRGGVTDNNDRVNYGASCSGVSQQPSNTSLPKSSGIPVKERLGQLITIPDDESQEKENVADQKDNDTDDIQFIPNSKAEVQVYTIDDEIEEAMSNSDDDSDDIRVLSEGNSDVIFIQKKQGEVVILAQVEGRVIKMNRKRKLCVTFGNTAKRCRLLGDESQESCTIDRIDSDGAGEETSIKKQGNKGDAVDGKCSHDISVSVAKALHFREAMQGNVTGSEIGDDCLLLSDGQENNQLQSEELAQDDKMDSDNSMGVSEMQLPVPLTVRDKIDSQNCARDSDVMECVVCEEVSMDTPVENSVDAKEEANKSSVPEEAVDDGVTLLEDSNDTISVAEDSDDVMALMEDSNDVVAILEDSNDVTVSEECTNDVEVAKDAANAVGAVKGPLIRTAEKKVSIDRATVVESTTDVETVIDDDGEEKDVESDGMVAAVADNAEVEIIDDDTTSDVAAIITSEETVKVATDTVTSDRIDVVLFDLEKGDKSDSEEVSRNIEKTQMKGTGYIEAVEATCESVEDIAELERNIRKDGRRPLQGSKNIQPEEDKCTKNNFYPSSEKKNQSSVEQGNYDSGEDILDISLGSSNNTLEESLEDNSEVVCSVQKEDLSVESDDRTESSSTGDIEVLEILTAGVGVTSKEGGRATRLSSRISLDNTGAKGGGENKDFSQARQQTTESVGIRHTRQNVLEKAAVDSSQKQSVESTRKGTDTKKQLPGKGNATKEQIAGKHQKAELQSPSTYSFRRRSKRF